MENADPVMAANFKSKNHIENQNLKNGTVLKKGSILGLFQFCWISWKNVYQKHIITNELE